MLNGHHNDLAKMHADKEARDLEREQLLNPRVQSNQSLGNTKSKVIIGIIITVLILFLIYFIYISVT